MSTYDFQYPMSTFKQYMKPLATVRHRDLAQLRLSCKAFDRAVQPVLFSEISIDCEYTRTSIVRAQLSSLAEDTDGPWRLYTKKLNIITLDPTFNRERIGDPTTDSLHHWEQDISGWKSENVKEMKAIIAQFLPTALKSLPNVHTLT